jgi:hypothetical protein
VEGLGGWLVFLAANTTPKPAAPPFVVFEAWAFLLPSLRDFLGCRALQKYTDKEVMMT